MSTSKGTPNIKSCMLKINLLHSYNNVLICMCGMKYVELMEGENERHYSIEKELGV